MVKLIVKATTVTVKLQATMVCKPTKTNTEKNETDDNRNVDFKHNKQGGVRRKNAKSSQAFCQS